MKKDNLEFDEIFNILADLFYYISHIIMEFKNNQKIEEKLYEIN